MYKPQIGTNSRLPKAKPVVKKEKVKKEKVENPVRFGANVGSPYKKKPVVEAPVPVVVAEPVAETPAPQEPAAEAVAEVSAFDIDNKEEPKLEGWKAKRDKKKQVESDGVTESNVDPA